MGDGGVGSGSANSVVPYLANYGRLLQGVYPEGVECGRTDLASIRAMFYCVAL